MNPQPPDLSQNDAMFCLSEYDRRFENASAEIETKRKALS